MQTLTSLAFFKPACSQLFVPSSLSLQAQMNPPPESLKVHRSREEWRLELAKFDLPDEDIDLLSDYIAANYNERRVLHTYSDSGKRDAYMYLAELLRLVRNYTTLQLLDGDVTAHMGSVWRVRACFPDDRLISTFADVLQNNLVNIALNEQWLQRKLELRQADVDRFTQVDDAMADLLQPVVVRLKKARDEARDELNRVRQAREALACHYVME